MLKSILLVLVASAHAGSSPPTSCEMMLRLSASPRADGLVIDGVKLSTENLIMAYRKRLYPIPDQHDIAFFLFSRRGVIFRNRFRLDADDRKIVRRLIRSGRYRVSFDEDFSGVLEGCAEQRRHTMNWLEYYGEPFRTCFREMHQRGIARSVEVWRGRDLVAGLYGVYLDGVFTGDSMFHRENNVSRLALGALLERLRVGGHRFLDCQELNGLIKSYGTSVPIEGFRKLCALEAKANRSY